MILAVTAVMLCERRGDGGVRYVDDFSQTSSVWRYGNAAGTVGEGGMLLNRQHFEMTLPGTVVHPDNLRTFTVSLEWSLCKIGTPTFEIGFGKPFEWSRFDECRLRIVIDPSGLVTVNGHEKAIGAWHLPASESDMQTLTIVQEMNRVVLRVGSQEASFTMPVGVTTQAGYLTLRLQAGGDRTGEQYVRVSQIKLDGSGDRPAMTAAERHEEIQRWARSRLQNNQGVLQRFASHLQSERLVDRWGYKTAMTISPGLIKLGERAELKLHITGPIPSPCEVKAIPDYLSANPGAPISLGIDWKSDVEGSHTATVDLSPARPGNLRVVWQVGGEELSRVIGVIDKDYTVCRLLLTTYPGMWMPNHSPEVYHKIHEYGLGADYWDGSEWTSPWSRTPEGLLQHYRIFADKRHRYGDRVFPLCNANYLIPGCPDGNLCRLDADVQRDGIQMLMRLWELLDLGAIETFGSYTFGHNTPGVARELGIKAIDSLVQWQNWRDGGDDNAWLINQWGSPTGPYFVAGDDYRKVAPGKSIVGLPQGTTSSARQYFINMLEGQPQLVSLRGHSDQMGETSNIDRFQTVVDLWLAEAPYQQEPLFIFIGLENFLNNRDWDQANTLGVEYLRDQALVKKLVFASGAAIADYFTGHYDKQPENWFYWPDTYCGYQVAYKPRLIPDRIELSNAEFHSEHDQGASLPKFFWDFTRSWSEPIWDDQASIRQKFGLCDPKQLTADNCVPRMVNLEGVKAIVNVVPNDRGVEVVIDIESSKAIQKLPVAAWGIPLDKDSVKMIESSPNARWIPIMDGSTGNLHGIIVCRDISVGKTTLHVKLQGIGRQPFEPAFRLGQYVAGRCFLRNGTPHAYLWLSEEKLMSGILRIHTPAGKKVRLHYNDGRVETSANGLLNVMLDPTWQHTSPLVTGLTPSELTTGATFEPSTVARSDR